MTLNRLYRFIVETNWPHAGLLGIATLIGAALGYSYADVGRIGLMQLMEGSSWAEWATVFATSVIGLAAWRYQHQSHVANIAKERRLSRATYANMIAKCVHAQRGAHGFSDFMEQAPSKRTVKDLELLTSISARMMGEISWTETERAHLDDDGVVELSDLEYECRTFLDVAKALLEGVKPTDRAKQVEDKEGGDIGAMRTCATSVNTAATTLLERLYHLRAIEWSVSTRPPVADTRDS